MTDDTPSTPRGSSDIESRLRHALSERAGGEPSHPADWGDFAGRLASATRRRQRVLVGAAALALCIGAAGGYLGEAAAAPVSVAARAPRAAATPSTTVPGGSSAPQASKGAVMCPDISGGPTDSGSGANGSGAGGSGAGGSGAGGSGATASAANGSSDIGSATQEFVRSTTDGVTIRVYQNAPETSVCNGLPTPVPGSDSNSASGSSSGPSGPRTPPTTIAPPTTPPTPLEPFAPNGNGVSIELSDADAVGQGAMSSPQCVMSGGGATTGGSGAGSSGQAGSTPASPPGTILPSNTPDATMPATTIPVTTTTTTASAPGQPQELASGAFGVVEGDPVWWVSVQVGANVTSVQMTFPDGSTDQMAPVDGIAVLAHRVTAAVASADTGPYVVRGSLELQGGAGSVIGTVTLPQATPTPEPVPSPSPAPVPLNEGTQSVAPGVIMVCPSSSTVNP